MLFSTQPQAQLSTLLTILSLHVSAMPHVITARDVMLSTLHHYTSDRKASLNVGPTMLAACHLALARARLIRILAGASSLSAMQAHSRLQFLMGSLDRIARLGTSKSSTRSHSEWLAIRIFTSMLTEKAQEGTKGPPSALCLPSLKATKRTTDINSTGNI